MDDKNNTDHHVAERHPEGFRGFPRGCEGQLPRDVDDRRRRRQTDIATPMKGLGTGVFEIALP